MDKAFIKPFFKTVQVTGGWDTCEGNFVHKVLIVNTWPDGFIFRLYQNIKPPAMAALVFYYGNIDSLL